MKSINKAIALVCVLGLLFTSVISINPIKASAADTSIYECENLTATVSAGDTVSNKADTNCSNGYFSYAALNATGDYLEYTVNVSTAGDYTMYVGSKNASNRGIYQLSIDGTNQGSTVDQYSAAITYSEANLGDVTFSTAGYKKFRFTVTGKNTTSNAYGLGFDYLKLVPVTNVASNIVTNPGFENTYTSNGILLASGWAGQTIPGQPPLNFSQDSTNKHSGNYSAKISSDVNSRGVYNQKVAAQAGKTYKFSMYVKTATTSRSSVGMRIVMQKADGTDSTPPVFVPSNTLSGNSDWTYVEKAITIPDNTTGVYIQGYYGVTSGSAWFDDANAVEYTPVQGLDISAPFGAIKVGGSINVPVKIRPDNVSDPKILWTSDNPGIATVSDGVVTGLSEGTTTITATTEEGGFSQKYVVYVSNSDVEILPSVSRSFSVDEDGSINGTLDETDANGNPLTYTVCNYAANGLSRVDSNGNFLYTPNKDFNGTDDFKAIALNGAGGIGLYDLKITVNAVNEPPVPGEKTVGVIQGTSVNDKPIATDPDKDSLTYSIFSNPTEGTLNLISTATGYFAYTANDDSTGEDSFTLTASDGKGGSTLCPVHVFIAPKGQKMIDTLKTVNANKAHPRIIAGQQTFDNLKSMLQNNDVYITKWFSNVKAVSDSMLSLPTQGYVKPDGIRLLDASREVLRRARFLSMTYRMTGDSKYAERLWTELNAAGNFPDWNPSMEFLDTAEMTNAFAIAYDWLYDYWSPERKTYIVKAIKEKGLIPGNDGYKNGLWWTKINTNWNAVCNGGLTAGALAVADEGDVDPDIEGIAASVLENAVKNLPYMLKEYQPDGGWYEGPIYWDYGTSYAAFMLSSMSASLGTDYGLSDLPGFDRTADFPIYNDGAIGSFNFSDASSGIVRSSTMLWLGTRFNNPSYYWAHRVSGTDAGDPMTMLWYPGYDKYMTGAPLATLDKKFGNAEVGTMHSDMFDYYGTFLGFKGGYNQSSHGHLDQGSFVYDALGVRWALDLGADDYNAPGYMDSSGGRWNYYRTRAEGHNTFVLNPGNYPDQNIFAKAKIEKFETNSDQTAAMSIIDLSDTYSKDAFSAKRGLALTNNKTDLLVQDEVRNRKPSDYWWFMHTDSNIDISPDGKSAILSNQGKRLFVQILSDEGQFTVMDAVPLPTSPVAKQGPNPGIKKLAVHLTNALDVNFAVRMVPLMSTDDIPTDKPAVVSFDNWKVQEQSPLFLDGISVAGTSVPNFNKYQKNYKVTLPYGTTSLPTVEAKVSNPDDIVNVELPQTLPGTAKITVTSKTNTGIKNSYYVELKADPGITASTAQDGNWPENSMDGNLTSRWAAEGDQWIQYYIGEKQVVRGMSIAYFRGNERKYLFDVLVSEDGVNWETVLSGVQTSGTTSDLVRYDFPELKAAKYVRIFGHGSNVNRWNNVAEVSIDKIVDNTPPVTAAKVDGTGRNGWYNSDVTVTLNATDDLSSVESTVYRIGDSGDWLTYTGTIAVTKEGINTVQYRSIDKAGNAEDVKQQTIQIDKTLPEFSLIVNGNILREGDSFDDDLPLTFKVSDNLSGVVSAQISVSDSVYAVASPVQSSVNIDLAGKVGSYTATVIVEDNAGNRLEKAFKFIVTMSIDSMRHLIDRFVKSSELDGAMVDQLTNNLNQVQHQLDINRPDQAAKHMEDFIKRLNNEALGSHITDKVKEILNNSAKALVQMWLGKDM